MYNYSIPVTPGENLSLRQWRAINIAGTLAANAGASMGILQNKPDGTTDMSASLVYLGRVKFAAGGTVSAGNDLTVATSGWVIVAAAPASGNSTRLVGKSEFNVASGGIGEGIFNFMGGTLVSFD